jgi:hypothetical protein
MIRSEVRMLRIGWAVFIGIAWTGSLALAAEPGPAAPFRGDLARAVFFGDRAITRIQASGLSEPLRARFTTFRDRFVRFRSSLPDAGLPREEPERAVLQKRRHVERAIVALIPRDGIEALAADYARQATIHYEWEGMSDGPLLEAEFAETALQQDPNAPIRPYLGLFILHRLRYAEAFLTSEKKPAAAAAAAARSSRYRNAATTDPDPLIRALAADIDLLSVQSAVRRVGQGEQAVGRSEAPRAGAAPMPEVPADPPPIPIGRALEMVGAHARERGLDLAGQFVHAARLEYDDASRIHPDGKRRRGPFWYIHWRWATPRLGGEVSARVYMDGEILVERHGP